MPAGSVAYPDQHVSTFYSAEVGKVTFKSNGDEALSDEFLLKGNGNEALNDVFSTKSNGDKAFNAKKKL
jgi:hypothetical protein